MAKAMVHLNSNILCAVDVETTGLNPEVHDVIQIAVLPLDSNIKPLAEVNGKSILPFYAVIKPKNPQAATKEAMKVNKLDLAHVTQHGIDPLDLPEIFEKWFDSLDLPVGKKIMPLGQNMAFDEAFLKAVFDGEYDNFFHYHKRCTVATALYLNDRAAMQAEECPFPKTSLRYLCSQLKINNERPHDALQDCYVTAEIYRRMMAMTHL